MQAVKPLTGDGSVQLSFAIDSLDPANAPRHAFAAQAGFIFDATPEILYSRLAHEALWKNWQSQNGFRVLACRSIEPHVHEHLSPMPATGNVAQHPTEPQET